MLVTPCIYFLFYGQLHLFHEILKCLIEIKNRIYSILKLFSNFCGFATDMHKSWLPRYVKRSNCHYILVDLGHLTMSHFGMWDRWWLLSSGDPGWSRSMQGHNRRSKGCLLGTHELVQRTALLPHQLPSSLLSFMQTIKII